MKDKLAIDIALLPPDDVMDLAIDVNRTHGPEFHLNKADRLPHITLSQAIYEQDDLDEIVARLKKIAANFKPIRMKGKFVNHPAILIEVEINQELQKLHQKIMDEFKDLASYKVSKEYYFDKDVREHTLNYVRKFRTAVAYENYYPHITLGVTKPIDRQPNIVFTAKRLTICHLGNYNTCRKILFETSLS